jgi:hypothetical protein
MNTDFDNLEEGDKFENMNEEYFASFEEHLPDTLKLRVVKKIDEYKDNTTKEIDDRIIIWNSSMLRNAETDEPITNSVIHSVVTSQESIVIETKCKFVARLVTASGNFSKNLDLIIYNKRLNIALRTSSDFVKVV